MNLVKNENVPILIPKLYKKNIKIIKSESNNHNFIEISQLRSIIDNENKTDNNKLSDSDSDTQMPQRNAIRNATLLQHVN